MAKRTFVVDDEKAISDSLAAILNHHGFLASAFYSPQSALARACKIVLSSGQAATADMRKRARARGYNFELPAKPVHPKQLLARLAAPKLHQPRQPGAYIHNSVRQRHMPPMQSWALQ